MIHIPGKYEALNKVLAIQLDELATKHRDWIAEVAEAVAGRSEHKESKVRRLFEDVPRDMQPLFRSTTQLARMQGLGRHTVKSYISEGRVQADLYSPASYFKYIRDPDRLARFVNYWTGVGLGFISTDFQGDMQMDSGFGILFLLPKQLVKYAIPYGVLYQLVKNLKLNLPYINSLKSRARHEREALVLLKEPYINALLTSKETLGVIEKEGYRGTLYTNYSINRGSLDGYPLFPERTVELYEHFQRDLAHVR